jgi:CD109 antigen
LSFSGFTDDNTKRVLTATVQSNSGATVVLQVTPVKVGYLPIKITARCDVAGDAIEQLLLVEPEGTPIYVNKAVLLDLRNDNSKTVDFTIDPPSIAVPDSTSATVGVFGDLLGNTIENLESLIRVPYGCAEQNMVAFIPNLLVLKYLKAVDKLTPALETRLINNMELGYQRQLNYQTYDGAFSFYGSFNNGNTWLTAFVLRYFAEASAYIKIDPVVLNRATNWLFDRQASNGSFTRYKYEEYIRGELRQAGLYSLTGHVLTAMLVQPNVVESRPEVIKAATDYIANQTASSGNMYGLAVCAYAMQKAGHPNAKVILDILDRQQSQGDGLNFWRYYSRTSSSNWYSYEDSINIEITALILSTYVESNRINDGFPVMNWLIRQRNSRGGYSGSQDTILSIQALALMAEKLYVKDTNIDVEVTYGTDEKYNVNVNKNNVDIVQNYELPLNTEAIKFDIKGTGLAIAQVSYKYYVLVPEPEPRFNLKVTIRESSTIENLDLSICTSFIVDRWTKKSNMPMIEVGLPSGYVLDPASLAYLKTSSRASVSLPCF